MKKTILLLAVSLSLTGYSADTNTPPTTGGILQDVKGSLGNITNYAFAPYLTYAPKAPTKYGGGILALYNVNNYVGAGVGVDWLGHFNLASGNVTLKVPTHPIAFLHWGWNPSFTPNVLAGVGVPFGGAKQSNGGVSGIAGVGGNLDLFDWKGFNLGAGAELINWSSADAYSGKHYEVFLDIHKGF